eukprot:UN23310
MILYRDKSVEFLEKDKELQKHRKVTCWLDGVNDVDSVHIDGKRICIKTSKGRFEWVSKSHVPVNLPEEYNSVGMLVSGLLGTEDEFKLLVEKICESPSYYS